MPDSDVRVDTEDRVAGYGLPAAEYHELYEIRETQQPLPRSQFWMGRFDGTMAWSVRVTPLVVAVDGLGQLLLQGLRMTTPGLEVTAGTSQEMPPIWPGIVTARWPEGEPVGDSRLLRRDFRTTGAGLYSI